MTLNHITAEPGDAPAIACTLTSASLAAQASRWVRLAARAMTRRAETAHGLRIFFAPEPGAEEELRALVAVEKECCSWADWAVHADDGHLVLDVRATGAGVAALRGMFTDLPSSRSGG